MPHALTFSCLLFLLLTACASEPDTAEATSEAPEELTTKLLGTWETVELHIEYPTYLNGDTAYVEHITEAEWGQKYGVNPPSTVYTADGKLRRTHTLKTGETANITNGIWRVDGDSLRVIEPNVTYNYGYELNGDRLELTGVVDRDLDGARDDRYRAVFRQTSRSR